MKSVHKILIASSVLVGSLGLSVAASANTNMLRLYNPNSGEHFYTASSYEKTSLVKSGWLYEGIGWVAPDSGKTVERLYNPNAGDHFYTTNSFEVSKLVAAGWKDEGAGWTSGGTIPVFRAYNPNATSGAHNYTTGTFEQSSLIKAGWTDEGTAFDAEANGTPATDKATFESDAATNAGVAATKTFTVDAAGNTVTFTINNLVAQKASADGSTKYSIVTVISNSTDASVTQYTYAIVDAKSGAWKLATSSDQAVTYYDTLK